MEALSVILQANIEKFQGALKTAITNLTGFEGQAGKVKDVKLNADTKPLVNGLKAGERAVRDFSTQAGKAKGITINADTAPAQKSIQSMMIKLDSFYAISAKTTDPKILTEYNRKIEETERAITKATNAGKKGFDEFGNKVDVFGRKVEESSQKMQRFTAAGEKLQSVGQNLSMYVTAPLVLMGGLALKTAGDFEASMNRVSAITGAVGKDFEDLKAQAIQLGIETKFTSAEAASGMTFLGMAGFNAAQTMAAMPEALNLASAGAMDLGRTADVLSNIMGQFGIKAENAARVTNVLAAVNASANTNIEQLSQALKYLGPTAKALGATVEDTAAMVGVLGDAGIQGSLAGRALGTSLVSLANPTKKSAEAMKAMNVQAFDAQENFVGFESLLRQIEKGTAGMTQKQKAANLQAMLGSEAFQEINILLERGADKYAAYTKRITGTNKAQEMAIKQAEGFNGEMRRLTSAVEGLQIAIAESGLLASLTSFAARVTAVVRHMAEANPQLLKFGAVLAAIAAAAGPVLFTLGVMSAGLPVLTAGFAGVATAATAAWAAITGPVGLIVAGLAAVAIAVKLISDQFPSVAKQAQQATDALRRQQQTVANLEDNIKPLVSRYEELKSKSKLSKEEQSELETIVRKIAAAVPGATTEVDKYGRAIGVSTEKVRSFIAENKALEQSMREGAITAKTKELQQYEKQLKQIEERAAKGTQVVINQKTGTASIQNISQSELAKLGEQADKLKEKIAAVRGERRSLFQEGQQGMGPNPSATKEIELLLDQTTELSEAQKAQLKVMEELQLGFDLAAKKARLYGSEIDNQNGAFKRYSEGQVSYAQYVSQTALSYDAAADKAKLLQGAIDGLLAAGASEKDSRILTLKSQLEALNNVDLSPMYTSLETALRKVEEFNSKAGATVKPITIPAMSSDMQERLKQDQALAQQAADFAKSMADSLASSIANTFAGMGEILGNMFAGITTGAQALEQFGNMILSTLGSLAQDFGKQLIALGVGKMALDKMFAMPGGGALAIAAGTALMAVGSALSASMAGSVGNLGPSANTSSISGTTASPLSTSYEGPKEIWLRAEGSQLVAVLDRTDYKTRRTRG